MIYACCLSKTFFIALLHSERAIVRGAHYLPEHLLVGPIRARSQLHEQIDMDMQSHSQRLFILSLFLPLQFIFIVSLSCL